MSIKQSALMLIGFNWSILKWTPHLGQGISVDFNLSFSNKWCNIDLIPFLIELLTSLFPSSLKDLLWCCCWLNQTQHFLFTLFIYSEIAIILSQMTLPTSKPTLWLCLCILFKECLFKECLFKECLFKESMDV